MIALSFGWNEKAAGPVCCVMHVKEPSYTDIIKRRVCPGFWHGLAATYTTSPLYFFKDVVLSLLRLVEPFLKSSTRFDNSAPRVPFMTDMFVYFNEHH